MEISVGHPLNQIFLIYYRSARGEMGSAEEEIVKESPERLIVWKEENEILGHAIWHPSDTETHPDGSQQEEDDREILLELLGGPAAFVELHEIWLLEEHQGKGHGEAFFDFFEDMMTEKGFYWFAWALPTAFARLSACALTLAMTSAEVSFVR